MPFREHFTTQFCFEQIALLPLNLKQFDVFGQYHVKCNGLSVPEHPAIKGITVFEGEITVRI